MSLVAGVRLGIDVGSVRVGVAVSDPGGILATPLTTLRRDTDTKRDLTQLADLVREHAAVEVVVGLPTSLSGRRGPAAEGAIAYAEELAGRIAPIPVRLHDERLTTVVAARNLTARGVRGPKQRAVVDQAAAVLILQHWLDVRSSGAANKE